VARCIEGISYDKVKPAVPSDRELAYFWAWSIIMDVQDAQGVLSSNEN
jgi:hypothetical protein